MSYSGRRKYKSRREKNKTAAQRARAILIAIIAAVALLIFINRVSIVDYLATYFY